MRPGSEYYLMENLEETFRLEIKTDPGEVRKQASWCGLKPGIRVLDAGCGPGVVTSILHEMIQPGGEILGIDYSEERIRHAKKHYGRLPGVDFQVHDLRHPLNDMGPFDLIWARFVLEYNRIEGLAIVKNLTDSLKPGGFLCLMDLDHNCLNHYELPRQMEAVLFELAAFVQENYNFDPYAGRKLYAYLYDHSYQNIQMELMAHHLFYGKIGDKDVYNWVKKMEVIATKTEELFEDYRGGQDAFFKSFADFLLDPRRFTYTPLILCKGMKPLSP